MRKALQRYHPAERALTSRGANCARARTGGRRPVVLIALAQIVVGVIGALLVLQPELAKTAPPPIYVVQISVDGLKPQYLQQLLDAGQAPNFAKLKAEGAWTLNARTDYDWTITLPNHTSMLTGRPVNDKYSTVGTGHRWTTTASTDQNMPNVTPP